MEWDFKDQLREVDLGGGGTAYYVYDSAGQRVRKVIESLNGARRKERIYLGGFEVYREFESDGATVELERESLHVMDDERRIALVETLTVGDSVAVGGPLPVLRYQLGNHLDSASAELDGDGALVSYEEFHPYGTTAFQAGRSAAEVSLKRYRYTAMERDDESGLAYHSARYYAPWLGRWTAADPLRLRSVGEGDSNLYAYVRGRAAAATDPSGMDEIVISVQIPKEADGDHSGTAVKLAEYLGAARPRWHQQSRGIVEKLQSPKDDNVSRIDTFGHTASGLVTGNRYRLNPGAATALDKKVKSALMIVAHGCGSRTIPGGIGNMEAFLLRFSVPVTMYTHDIRSGPGMPFNWVENRIVTRADGSSGLESTPLGGDAKVIGRILPKEFVRWWAREQDRRHEPYLENLLLSRYGFRLTDDVRAVLLDEFRSIAQRDLDLNAKYWDPSMALPARTRDPAKEPETPSAPVQGTFTK